MDDVSVPSRPEPPATWGWRRVVPTVGAALVAAALGGALLVGAAPPAAAAQKSITCANTGTDAATIQAGINSSAAGDEVVIHGRCLITATITLLGDRGYRGDSRRTWLTAATGSNLAAVLASDTWVNDVATPGVPITLSDLHVDANAAGNPTAGDGIVIRSWQTTIQNVTIENARQNGLRLANASKGGVALSNNMVGGTIRDLFVTASGANGVFVDDPASRITDWNLVDSQVASSGKSAIRADNTAGWSIVGDHVYGVGEDAIRAYRTYGSTIADNYIEDFVGTGIAATVVGQASTITGNKILQLSGAGHCAATNTYLSVGTLSGVSGQVVVANNSVRGCGTGGTGLAYSKGSGATLTLTSTGNQVTGVATPKTVGAGITVDPGQ